MKYLVAFLTDLPYIQPKLTIIAQMLVLVWVSADPSRIGVPPNNKTDQMVAIKAGCV